MPGRFPSVLSLVRELRSRISLRGSGWISHALPVTADVAVTPATALSVAAAYAAINRIATDLASLSLHVYRRREDGGREIDRDFPLYDVLHLEPNDEMSSFTLRQTLSGHALGWGNGYGEIGRSKWSGAAGEIWPLDPAKVTPDRTSPTKTKPYGSLVYVEEGVQTPHLAEDILHIHPIGYDGVRGYSPVQLHRQGLGISMAAEGTIGSFYGRGVFASGYLKVKRKLADEEVLRLRDDFSRAYTGAQSSYSMVILPSEVEPADGMMPLQDAQFLETRRFQVEEVARIYLIPPWKIGDYSKASMRNVEEGNLDYLSTTIMPWCVHVEQEFTRKLLTRDQRKTWQIEHAMTSFLRGNMAARAQFYAAMASLGVMSPNDIARAENLNPIGPAGDKHYVPLNLAPIEDLDGARQTLAKVFKVKPEDFKPPAGDVDGGDIVDDSSNGKAA